MSQQTWLPSTEVRDTDTLVLETEQLPAIFHFMPARCRCGFCASMVGERVRRLVPNMVMIYCIDDLQILRSQLST
jgi:hypothetical protein